MKDTLTCTTFPCFCQGRPRGVVVYHYTRKKFAKIPQNTQDSPKYTQNYTQVYFIPEIQRKWYTEYPYLSCNIRYTRFKSRRIPYTQKPWPTLFCGFTFNRSSPAALGYLSNEDLLPRLFVTVYNFLMFIRPAQRPCDARKQQNCKH